MLTIFVTLALFFSCDAVHPGPLVTASKGEVWPKPQQEQKTEDYFIIKPHAFSFKGPDNIGCPNLLDDAFTRYWTIIATSSSLERRGRLSEVGGHHHKKFWKADKSFLGNIDSLSLQIEEECSEDIIPQFGDNENYTLTVNADGAILSSGTIWGALRGLETFSQLVHLQDDELIINATSITDFPRFPHRGLHLDTSRHFHPLYIIFQILDAMAYNKFNIFHWHLTDDQSFPYRSRTYPELSDKGAFHPISKVYEQNDISRVIQYARVRGIRVVPEFDTPGHTASWGLSYPELLSTCYTNGEPNADYGPMDPTKETTYEFLTNLFTEIVGVFPDAYFHIGGDEVDFDCWESNPDVNNFMASNNLTSYPEVQNYFIQRVVDLLDSLNTKYLVWDEVFVNGASLSDSALVHVWRDQGPNITANVTAAGKKVIYSSCWYLDHLEGGGDWQKYYECEPLNFPGTDDQKKLILGGEACMWSEVVNEYNVISRIWPRASAAAEKLWSASTVNDFDTARPRLEEHTCRMNHRGIGAQPPNGAGVCL